MSSVKGNVILNALNTVSGILFPIITFPYAARVVLPEGIGAVNFLTSIVNYIILLTSLGIPMYAVKEIAKYRDDPVRRDTITVEILLLSLMLSAVGYVGVVFLAAFVPQIHAQAGLFYVLSLSILFTALGVNWFYQGIEDFKFITVRAIVIRVVSALALFLLVKSPDDLLMYGIVTVISTVGNNLVNIIHLRRYVHFRTVTFGSLNIMRHTRPVLQVFVLNLITSLYVQLNSIMLGFMSGDEAVGFFTAGNKIVHVALMLITSAGAVLLPRCSHLIKCGDTEGFAKIINKSLNLAVGLSLPIMAGLMILAVPVTLAFCGPEFIDTIPVLYWTSPVILFISLTNIIGIQVLYPQDKVGLVILSVSGGALVNIVLNVIMIPPLGALGAAIPTFMAELAVLVIQLIVGWRYCPFDLHQLGLRRYTVATMAMSAVLVGVMWLVDGAFWQLCTGIVAGVSVYALTLFQLKDPLFIELLGYVGRGADYFKKHRHES